MSMKNKCQFNLFIPKSLKDLLEQEARRIAYEENKKYTALDLGRDLLLQYVSGSILKKEGKNV